MALIQEDGTGMVNANCYGSVADADAYHTLFANGDWAGDNATKELALITATKACDLLFGQKYLSMPQTSKQSLLFPRYTFVINTVQMVPAGSIPRQLKEAIFELALLQITGTNIFPTQNTKSQIQTESVKLGDLATTTTYGHTPLAEQFEGFWKIEMILTPIIRKTGVGNNASAFGY